MCIYKENCAKNYASTHSLLYLDKDVGAFVISSISSNPRCIDTASKLSPSLYDKYSIVSKSCFFGLVHNFNNKLDPTTETELIAIAALAIHGANINPKVLKAPAANGIPKKTGTS